MRRPSVTAGLATTGMLLAACGGTGATATSTTSASAPVSSSPTVSSPSPSPSASPSSVADCSSTDDTTLEITARGYQFDTKCLAAAAGEGLSVVFHNEDSVLHNFAILKGSAVVFSGTVVFGPKTVTYKVKPLKAGEYVFRCNLHDFMTGTLHVGT